jgi:hypothetical protein
MPEIVLTDEQARVVRMARKPIQVRDARGNTLGWIQPIWTEEDIVEAKKAAASEGPWRTTEQVLERLRSAEPHPDHEDNGPASSAD